ncbi:MAG TPA: GTP cyclohydrolase II RibA [Pyrinomonadaceae bacterium]
MIVRLTEGQLKTRFGVFREILYYDGQKESIALVLGDTAGAEDVLCRVHSSCIRGHVFNSIECDCREQLETSQLLIEQAGRGIIIWFDQEGRGNGHMALLASIKLKNEGVSQTQAYLELGFEADARSYKRAAEILDELKVKSVVLLTNNPDKVADLEKANISISGTKRIEIEAKNDESGNVE